MSHTISAPDTVPDTAVDVGSLSRLIGFALRRAQAAVFQDFAATLETEDIRPAQYSVLEVLRASPGLRQAQVFAEVVDVTGIVLTKLDGTAKGGIVVAVQRELGVPVKLVGLGEGPDDLAPFDPAAFVDALLD